MLLWHPLLLWLFILSHHQYMSGYHDPVAAGRWSYVPLRLLPSELFDPAGRPCSPPPRDSVTTPSPDRQKQTETINISGAGIKLKHVFTLCVCVQLYLPVVSSHRTEERSHTPPVALLNGSPLIQQQPTDSQPATSCCCCQS